MVQKDGWVISEVQRHIIGYFFPKKQEVNNLKGVLLWVLDETIVACIRLCSDDHGECVWECAFLCSHGGTMRKGMWLCDNEGELQVVAARS